MMSSRHPYNIGYSGKRQLDDLRLDAVVVWMIEPKKVLEGLLRSHETINAAKNVTNDMLLERRKARGT